MFAVGVLTVVVVVAYLLFSVVRSGVNFAVWRTFSNTQASKSHVVNGDVRINFATYGSGTPLVLLHGGLSSSLDWIGEIPALSREFQVVVIDLRGHAGSTMGSEEFSYRLLATDVVAVLDKLDIDRASIAGWSDGGNVGLLFALNYPDRIDRLIAISANFSPQGVSDEVMQNIAHAPDQAGSMFGRWLYRLQSLSPDHWPLLQNRVSQMWQSHPTLTIDDLQRISARTLLVVGARDNIDRQHSDVMATAIPHADLIVFPGVGHSVPRDAPAILVENMLRFLSANQAP